MQAIMPPVASRASGRPTRRRCQRRSPRSSECSALPTRPVFAPSQGIESAARLGTRRVDGDRAPGFAAFLDGMQSSRVVRYVDGIPIVHGTVAAVIRVRRDRRLFTWPPGPIVRSRMYIPRALVPAALWTAYDDAGFDPHDSAAADPSADASSRHPFALLERAVHAVQVDREASEQRLAEQWCEQEQEPIFIDGGISKSDKIATAPCAVGVIKNHRTLYVDTSDLATLFALPEGSRSTVFEIHSTRRTPVASWYLRLRDSKGRDPMWGLLRIECHVTPPDGYPIEPTRSPAGCWPRSRRSRCRGGDGTRRCTGFETVCRFSRRLYEERAEGQ